ncbi:MAG: hypothetical protein RR595_12160 [Lysinibacillus sp.]
MEQINQMEYRGLSLLDEIRTVELAIDENTRTLHIYDIAEVVAPIYNFDKRTYELSEGFYKMGDVLRNKRILTEHEEAHRVTLNEWIANGTFYFYVPQKKVKMFADDQIVELSGDHSHTNQKTELFSYYKERIEDTL